MSCKREQLLPLYAGGDLPWLRAALLRRHIKRCGSCRSELQLLEKTTEAARAAVNQRELSIQGDELWQHIQSRLPDAEAARSRKVVQSGRRRRLLARPALVFTGVAIIALAFIFAPWKKDLQQFETATSAVGKQSESYPILEAVDNPNVTVMTYLTDDPNIKIVWLFED